MPGYGTSDDIAEYIAEVKALKARIEFLEEENSHLRADVRELTRLLDKMESDLEDARYEAMGEDL